jgi:hypothetical protein
MPMVTPASPDDRPKGWLISVQTTNVWIGMQSEPAILEMPTL